MQIKKSHLVMGVALLSVAGSLAWTRSIFGLEIPAPRYSETTDYPSVVANALEREIAGDLLLRGQNLKVLSGWGWRRGRYDASLQVWNVANQGQQDRLLEHLRAIKVATPDHRTITVEFINLLPGAADSLVVGRKVL